MKISIFRTVFSSLFLYSVFFVCFLATAAQTAVPDVAWESRLLELSPGLGEESARGRFSFVNEGENPLIVERIRVPCASCSVELADPPEDRRYLPGATGHIDVEASFIRGAAEVRHNFYVTLRRGEETATETLTVEVNASPYATISPSALIWRRGTSPETQKAVLEAARPPDLYLTGISKSGEAPELFEVTYTEIEAGRRYEISARPTTTDELAMATLLLLADFPDEEADKTYELLVSIRPEPSFKVQEPGLLNRFLVLHPAWIATAFILLLTACACAAVLLFLRIRRPKS